LTASFMLVQLIEQVQFLIQQPVNKLEPLI